MRGGSVAAALVAILAASCGPKPPPMPVTPVSPARAACLAQLPDAPADAPVVALYERNPWLLVIGSDFPTIAVWADGTVVYVREGASGLETLEGSIGAGTAGKLARSVVGEVRTAPEHASVGDTTDAPTVEIVARDGDSWRVADVYGLRRDDANRDAPAGFVTAYRQLLAARPSEGTEFVPADVEVLLWGFEYANGEGIPWPADVPAPPDDVVPIDGPPYSHVVDAKYRFALRDLVDAAGQRGAIGINGHKWAIAALWRFRGQGYIRSVLQCAHAVG
jgi:hypothetical protein